MLSTGRRPSSSSISTGIAAASVGLRAVRCGQHVARDFLSDRARLLEAANGSVQKIMEASKTLVA